MTIADNFLAAIPSPTQSVWHVVGIPLRAYALCILVGIIAACAITEVRLRRRGAPRWLVLDIAVWAVPFGIVGGRVYHVITSPESYFGRGGDPLAAFKVWEGGLGIWGAVALGAVGAWIGCRRVGVPLTFFVDAVAPALPVAQAIGRLGNWFNNELYGKPTNLPWGLTVYDFNLKDGVAATDIQGSVEVPGGPFHPTFLYELLWNLGVAALVLLVDRRWKLGRGRAFALYVMAYTVGRFWIEALRFDEANELLGMRVNSWVSIIVFLGALAYFLRVRGPQEHVVERDGMLTLVTAAGEPITWRRSAPAMDSAAAPAGSHTTGDTTTGDTTTGDMTTGDTTTGGSAVAESPAGGSAAAAPTAGEPAPGKAAVAVKVAPDSAGTDPGDEDGDTAGADVRPDVAAGTEKK